MKKIGKNSVSFRNVFLLETANIVGKKEGKGPLQKYFDEIIEDNYFDESSFELAEIKMVKKSFDKLLLKAGIMEDQIDFMIGGDLNNQIAITNYFSKLKSIPLIGVYAACATVVLALIIAGSFEDNSYFENTVVFTSSHNSTSERQFRFPTEYGGQSPNSLTYTTTGAASFLVSRKHSRIRITRATLGEVIDSTTKDGKDMGRAMAPAAVDTLLHHFEDFNIDQEEYDLIVTGDLSKYGSLIFTKLLEEQNIILKNYKDSGSEIFSEDQLKYFAGGSGSSCIAIYLSSIVYELLRNKTYKKVLIIATGALLNPIMVSQKQTIPCIAHAIAFEREDEE